MQHSLDFYFFVGSTYSYLSVARAAKEAAQAGVALNWKPFSVRTLMREQHNSPFSGKPRSRLRFNVGRMRRESLQSPGWRWQAS